MLQSVVTLNAYPRRPQVALLQQLPHARITVVDLAALPLRHQVALVHRTHVMVRHTLHSISRSFIASALIRSVYMVRG
jgi:hypothetical protein